LVFVSIRKNIRPSTWCGRVYAEKKQNDRAITDFKTMIEMTQDEAPVYEWLRWLTIKEQKYDEAIPYLNRSIELRPDRAWGHYQRGRFYHKKNDGEQILRPRLQGRLRGV